MDFKIITEEGKSIKIEETLVDKDYNSFLVTLIDGESFLLNETNVSDLIMCLEYKLKQMK